MNYHLRLLAFLLLSVAAQAGVNVRVNFQDGTSLSRDCELGWNRLGRAAPLGVEVFDDDSLLVVNGIAGPGGIVYLTDVRVTLDYHPIIIERAGWRVEGKTIVIGNGGECMPPRSGFHVRWWHSAGDVFHLPDPPRWEFHVGPTTVQLPEYDTLAYEIGIRHDRLLTAIRTGNAEPYTDNLIPDLFEHSTGLWHLAGKALSDGTYGGGWGIEPVSGWERDPMLTLLRNDLTMERHAVYWLDGSTGLPAPALATENGHYSLARGWAETTQPVDVCDPIDPTNLYDQRRKPKRWNTGTCPYEAWICGLDVYNGMTPHDGQHIIRATRHGKAAVQLWADPFAQYSLAMIAQDCAYAWPAIPLVQPGQGSSSAGTREWAWVVDSYVAGGRDPAPMAQAALTAQMPNGMVMRMSSNTGWVPIPSPYVFSEYVQNPFPLTKDASPSMEDWFCAHVFVETGHYDAASRMAWAVFGPRPKGQQSIAKEFSGVPTFFGVGDRFSSPYRKITGTCGPGNYFPWTILGLMYWADVDHQQQWLDAMLDINTPTGGKGKTFEIVHALLVGDKTGRSQTIAAQSALEDYLKVPPVDLPAPK